MKITTVLTVLAAIVVVQAVPISSSIPHGESITLSSNIQVMEKRAPFVGPNSDLLGEHYIKRSDDKHDRKKRTFESVGTRRYPSFSPSGSFGSGVSGDLRKRHGHSPNSVTKIVKRAGGYNPSDPQGGYGGYGSRSEYRKRHYQGRGSITKPIKRGGKYNPSDPQNGYGDDLKKRRDLSSSASNISRTFKRSGGYNPSNPQGGEGGVYGDGGYGGDLKKRSSTMSDTFRKREGGLDPVDPFANVAKSDADLK
ncbi:hypothetical protein BGZ89_011674 [Linnemannia elongata]|nr:hypothetical protein BGZ89_011674 [Linnemannia elongata]